MMGYEKGLDEARRDLNHWRGNPTSALEILRKPQLSAGLGHLAVVREELIVLVRSRAFPGPEALERWAALLEEDLQVEGHRWITEDRAQLRCGRSTRWLRQRFKGWAQEGYAKVEQGVRLYYAPTVPRRGATRVTTDDPREQARRDVS